MAIFVHLALLAPVLGCEASGQADRTSANAGWQDTSAGAVGRPAIGGGVTAVPVVGTDGRLRMTVFDLTSGRRLWSQPTATAGRPADLGIASAAVAPSLDRAVVVSVEPRSSAAAVVGRNARDGRQLWARTVGTTLGPARCGDAVCVSESIARKNARFVVLKAATGETSWTMPGVAEVEWADDRRVVVFRIAEHPVVEAHDLRSGRLLWSFAVEDALGRAVDLSGGWSFGAVDDCLIGYLAPYRGRQGAPLSAFGFFSLRLGDGGLQWVHRRSLRIYPSANPAVALITREVDRRDQYGGFTQLDPRTGRTVAAIPVTPNPGGGWWPAFPADLSALGLLNPSHAGRAYDLRTGHLLAGHVRAWSLCTVTSTPLKINGNTGFFPAPALCPYDLMTGRRLASADPPPGWYTGAVDGWRVWRDDRGGLHGRHDADGTVPGMLG
ncbi:PQQ-like beta-propeller repeat protein [Actinoallomurus purpureus]|uniref:outer membrane protein assembly factor BamB family protein n=1 Tax=Actinoallomurus purpureus TaxID=478114 RepID=UPI0020930F21|nr:PQQ-binding-like beta-propeller repeat protein [Actinoallomurus purpureus]MCO6006709.1 PQQ-like beta-propeller repeat protein [Actinoallomurus purpureus]